MSGSRLGSPTGPRVGIGLGSVPSFVADNVSTHKQGRFGLGLAVQSDASARPRVQAVAGLTKAEFQEFASGKRADRSQLLAAISVCPLPQRELLHFTAREVRTVRPSAIGTREQEKYVLTIGVSKS